MPLLVSRSLSNNSIAPLILIKTQKMKFICDGCDGLGGGRGEGEGGHDLLGIIGGGVGRKDDGNVNGVSGKASHSLQMSDVTEMLQLGASCKTNQLQ